MSEDLNTQENDRDNRSTEQSPGYNTAPGQASPVRQTEAAQQAVLEPQSRQTATWLKEKPPAVRTAVCAVLSVALILFFILGLHLGSLLGERMANTAGTKFTVTDVNPADLFNRR